MEVSREHKAESVYNYPSLPLLFLRWLRGRSLSGPGSSRQLKTSLKTIEPHLPPAGPITVCGVPLVTRAECGQDIFTIQILQRLTYFGDSSPNYLVGLLLTLNILTSHLVNGRRRLGRDAPFSSELMHPETNHYMTRLL